MPPGAVLRTIERRLERAHSRAKHIPGRGDQEATVAAEQGVTVTWVLAAGSYLAALAVTVLVGTRGRPRRLLGRLPDPGVGNYDPPDAIEKVAIVLYPLLFAALAAVVWAVLWFGLYAVD
jgi:hypothetical protein